MTLLGYKYIMSLINHLRIIRHCTKSKLQVVASEIKITCYFFMQEKGEYMKTALLNLFALFMIIPVIPVFTAILFLKYPILAIIIGIVALRMIAKELCN